MNYLKNQIASFLILICVATGCGNRGVVTEPAGTIPPSEGEFDRTDRENVNPELAESGWKIYDAKCSRCHSIETESHATTFVGVTVRHDDEWLMEYMMNHDLAPFSERDEPVGREKCAVRSTEGALEKEEARKVLEYMHTL